MKKNYLKILTTIVCVTGFGVGLSACNSTSSSVSNGSSINSSTPSSESSVSTSVSSEIENIEVESITLNKSSLTLEVGEEETLIATIMPNDATNKTVTWNVEPAGVITVDNGKITAIAPGNAVVIASAGEKRATCNVTVNNIKDPVDENGVFHLEKIEVGGNLLGGQPANGYDPKYVVDKTDDTLKIDYEGVYGNSYHVVELQEIGSYLQEKNVFLLLT